MVYITLKHQVDKVFIKQNKSVLFSFSVSMDKLYEFVF
jgi:hypothetical protein